MDRRRLEAAMAALPLYDYAFFKTAELVFSDRVRYICEHECRMYDKSWACPPAVGTVEDCRARVMAYREGLLLSTVAEVGDIADTAAALGTRAPHEAITRAVLALVQEQTGDALALSTEACACCPQCAWPDAPCRRPERMLPCVESYGILLTDLAQRHGLQFTADGNFILWFSLILYNE